MSRIAEIENKRQIARAAALGAAIGVSFILLVALRYVLEDCLSPRALWQIRLVFLIVLELTYGLIATALTVAIPLLAVFIYRARKRRQTRPILARLLLLCVSLVLVLPLSELIAGAWWRQAHRTTALPVGGLDPSVPEEKPKLPKPPEQIQLPLTFADRGQPGTFEIVVVGESSAAGVPYDWWLSIANMLTWQLEKIVPGKRFDFTILAAAGDTLEVQHTRLALLKKRPDLLVIYAGHNEFSARFPWLRQVHHYADGHDPGLWDRLVQSVESRSPLCGWIREEISKCRVAIPPPAESYRSLVDEPVYTREERQVLLSDFERRLDAIVSFARQVKALPVLISPPSNEFDYEPNRSFLPPETTRWQRDAFTREFLAIRRREESDPRGSLAAYRTLLVRHPSFAELHFRVARLLARLGLWDEAYRHSVLAREMDGFPERCPPAFQDVYRTVAARHQCPLIDGQEYFHKIGYHGLLDDHLFHDGLHPSLRGQIALTQAVLQAIHDHGALGWPAAVAPPVIDPGECARHFRLTPWAWEKICDFGIMFYGLTTGLRYDPSERIAKRARFGSALERIKAGEQPEALGLVNVGVPEPVPLVPAAAFVPPSVKRRQSSKAVVDADSPGPHGREVGEAK
jgi:hypothetical protein